MKLTRTALLFIGLATSAQTPGNGAAIRAHAAYNAFADIANEWTMGHDDNLWSKADHDRLNRARAAWKRFDGLAREAQF